MQDVFIMISLCCVKMSGKLQGSAHIAKKRCVQGCVADAQRTERCPCSRMHRQSGHTCLSPRCAQVLEAVTALDIATARARHAAWLGAMRPRLLRAHDADARGCVRVRAMRHPLLLQRALPPLPEPPAAAEADLGASHLSMLGLPPPPPPGQPASAATNGALPVAPAITTALALDLFHTFAVISSSYLL